MDDVTDRPLIEVTQAYTGSHLTAYLVDVLVPSICLDRGKSLRVEGIALRDQVDTYDARIGECLALSRALSAAAKGLDKQAQGLIKHQDDMRADRKRRLLELEQEAMKEPLIWDAPPESRVPQYGDRVTCDKIPGRQHFYFGYCKNPKLVPVKT
jgi:Domain of unknown function (DUF1876)